MCTNFGPYLNIYINGITFTSKSLVYYEIREIFSKKQIILYDI